MIRRDEALQRLSELYGRSCDHLAFHRASLVDHDGKVEGVVAREPLVFMEDAVNHQIDVEQSGCTRGLYYFLVLLIFYVAIGLGIGWVLWA